MKIKSSSSEVVFKAADHTDLARNAADLASFHDQALVNSGAYAGVVNRATQLGDVKVKLKESYERPGEASFKALKRRHNIRIRPEGLEKPRTRSAVLRAKEDTRLSLVFEMHNAAEHLTFKSFDDKAEAGEYEADPRTLASPAEQALERQYGKAAALYIIDVERIEFGNAMQTDRVEDELEASGGERISGRFGHSSLEEYLLHCLHCGHATRCYKHYMDAARRFSPRQCHDKALAGGYGSDPRALSSPALVRLQNRFGRAAALYAMDLGEIEFRYALNLRSIEADLAAIEGRPAPAAPPAATLDEFFQSRLDGGQASQDCRSYLDAAKQRAVSACSDHAASGAYRSDTRPLTFPGAPDLERAYGREAVLYAMDMAVPEFEHALKTQVREEELEAETAGLTSDFSSHADFPAFLEKWIGQGHAARFCGEYLAQPHP